jgi:hypothetical protein
LPCDHKASIQEKKYPAPQVPDGFFHAASTAVNIARSEKNAPRSKRLDAIIDSGASGCLFHASIGRAVGLDIEKGIVAETLGVTGPSKLFLNDITIRSGRANLRSGGILRGSPNRWPLGHVWIL